MRTLLIRIGEGIVILAAFTVAAVVIGFLFIITATINFFTNGGTPPGPYRQIR